MRKGRIWDATQHHKRVVSARQRVIEAEAELKRVLFCLTEEELAEFYRQIAPEGVTT